MTVVRTVTTAAVARMAGDVPASPVVLVGGIAQRASSWSAWVDDLTQAKVPHIIARAPRAGFASRASYHEAIDGARSLMLSNAGLADDSPVSIIGFSAGGVGAVDYLRRHPDLVDRVVAASTPLRGNWLASAATNTLRPLTPEWVRDLSSSRAVINELDSSLGGRVTSLIGPNFDGIITRRSGRADAVRVVDAARHSFHPFMQERNAALRQQAYSALA